MCCCFFAKAQDMKVAVELEGKSLKVGEILSIRVVIQNSDKRDVKGFPELLGMTKRVKEGKSVTTNIAGKLIVSQEFTQTYLAEKVGNFRYDAFMLSVNGQQVKIESGVITIVADDKTGTDKNNNDDDFDSFINNSTEFIDVKEEAFLALRSNKTKVYVGEGFSVKLALYVAETNKAEMDFTKDTDAQIAEIIKKITPANCLVEDFKISDIVVSSVVINNKNYREYKMYQGVFYAINSQTVVFPGVSLRLVKFKVAKEQLSNNDATKKQAFTTLSSKSLSINPIPLPPHPLRDKVVVGEFRLQEGINQRKAITGKSIEYELHLVGKGNLSVVNMAEIKNDSLFDFYAPDIEQSIDRVGNEVSGEVSFKYQIIPKQAGVFALGKYFNWTFFNPTTQKYETLVSRIKVEVSGKKIDDNNETNGDLYGDVDNFKDDLNDTDYWAIVKEISSILLVGMLVGMAFVFWNDWKKG